MEARRRGRGALSPLLDGRNDRGEVLRLHRICPGFMHMPKSRGEIVEGTLTVQVAEALDRTLQGYAVKKLPAGLSLYVQA